MYVLEGDNNYNFDILGVFSTKEEAETYARSYADDEFEDKLCSTEPQYKDSNHFFFETEEDELDFRIRWIELNPIPIESHKQTYTVNLEYHDSITLNVMAKSEEEAKEKAIDAWTKEYNYIYDIVNITATVEEEKE